MMSGYNYLGAYGATVGTRPVLEGESVVRVGGDNISVPPCVDLSVNYRRRVEGQRKVTKVVPNGHLRIAFFEKFRAKFLGRVVLFRENFCSSRVQTQRNTFPLCPMYLLLFIEIILLFMLCYETILYILHYILYCLICIF